MSKREVTAKIKQMLEWLEANKDKLIWNPQTGRFKIKGEAVEIDDGDGGEVF